MSATLQINPQRLQPRALTGGSRMQMRKQTTMWPRVKLFLLGKQHKEVFFQFKYLSEGNKLPSQKIRLTLSKKMKLITGARG